MSYDKTQAVFKIPSFSYHRFQAEIARLVKRAEKIGVPAPTYNSLPCDYADENGVISTVYEVRVTGDAPQYDGWSFVAAIDIDLDNPGAPNVVHVLPGFVKDPEWTTMAGRCDHCQMNRNRKKLVVVQHENGERKVVGSTCLHDFLGHTSPQAIAAWAEMLAAFMAGEEDTYEEGPRGDRSEYRVDPVTYLAWVVKTIGERGWVSRSKATDRERATADVAFSELWNSFPDPIERPSLAEFEEARQVLEWGQEIELVGNDYLDNLAAVAQKSGWRVRDFGLGASMVNAFRRAQGRTPSAPSQVSDYVGQEGQKIEIEDVTVLSVREINSDWGLKSKVTMRDGIGNILVWWTQSEDVPEEGDVVDGSAKVKKHGEFRGVKETTITYFAWKAVESA